MEQIIERDDKHRFRVFIIICIGQLVSVLGSGLTNFAVGIWVYQKTGSVTSFALTILAIAIPSILLSPFAGALVDRWNRRWTIILGDSIAGFCSLVIAALLYYDALQVWHICIIVAVAAAAGVLQSLAFIAAVPLLVPDEELSRASGLMEIGPAIARIVAPLLAGMLLAVMSIYWVLLIDFASFLIAVFTTLIIHIPNPPATEEGESGKGSLLSEAASGWTYVKARPGLVLLLVVFAIINFTMSMSDVILVPMWLGMASTEVVGRLASISSSGMLIGSIALSIWGGPKRRIKGVLGFTVILGLCLMLAGLKPSLVLIAIGCFGLLFTMPIIFGCNQAIWLSKTPPDMQGRVSSIRMMIGWSATPLAYLLAGPLADKVFEPLLASEGALAGSVGKIIGVGPGRGIGLLLIVLGALVVLTAIVGYMIPKLWRVEEDLQDAMPEVAGGGDESVLADEPAVSL